MFHYKQYREYVRSDEMLYSSTRELKYPLPLKYRLSPEVKITRLYRFAQVNRDNIIGRLVSATILKRYGYKVGITLSRNTTIGKGFLIGHWGRIVINSNAIIGDDFVVSNGVVIGMDMRGKRRGVPTIGNRVCIHANSCVVGNIRIGNDVVIAPNTFVNFDVPDHSIVIGNPASVHHRDNATEGYIGSHSINE